MPAALPNKDQKQIINEILDTPLSERSISDMFSIGSSRNMGGTLYNAPETPDSSTQGRRRLESGMDFDCLDENNNLTASVGQGSFGTQNPIGSPLGRFTPAPGATRLQRLNPGLTLNTLSRSSLDTRSSGSISSPWFDSPSLTPMTPQIVRSPYSPNSYCAGSPSFGSTSADSYSPPHFPSNSFGGDTSDLSSYYHNHSGGGDYFSYGPPSYSDSSRFGRPTYTGAHNGGGYPNASMTDSSNVDSIDDLLNSLSLTNTGWTNLANLANVRANNVHSGAANNAPGANNLDYAILAAHYYDSVRKHQDLVNQLDSVLASLMMNGGAPPSSPLTSPCSTHRSSPPHGCNTRDTGYSHSRDSFSGGALDYNGVQSTLDIAARHHRSSANSQVPQKSWSGVLPLRTSFTDETLSNKIFLGGVPWDTPEYLLLTVFGQYGPVKVEWPAGTPESPTGPKGFAYLVYDSAASAKAMLDQCAFDGQSYYYKIPSKKRGRENQGSMVRSFKDVEVVPWAISDSNYSPQGHSTKLEPGKTIFVGALHGRLTAQALFLVMNELFGDVVYAGIDTDKHKYPIGSGRITFASSRAYSDAIRAAFIEVKSGRICKKLQIDPYLEDNVCSECQTHSGPYFCREGICYRYFCRSCWLKVHIGDFAQHEPIVRNVRKSPPSSPSGPHLHQGPVTGSSSLTSFGSLLSRSSLI